MTSSLVRNALLSAHVALFVVVRFSIASASAVVLAFALALVAVLAFAFAFAFASIASVSLKSFTIHVLFMFR